MSEWSAFMMAASMFGLDRMRSVFEKLHLLSRYYMSGRNSVST